MRHEITDWRTTFGLAIGMLVGGYAGAAVGAAMESEAAVLVGYAVCAVIGAAGGSWLGKRWQLRRRS